MVFRKLLGSLGAGGPVVDTVLDPGAAYPGGTLTGRIRLTGGTTGFVVESLAVELVARVGTGHDAGENEDTLLFERFLVAGGFRLEADERRDIPFGVPLPWETPLTELYGQPLGVELGVRTGLAVAGARDKGDTDPLTVAPLPGQEAVLDALGGFGFGFRSAVLEQGHVPGTIQYLPFHQVIALTPGPRHDGPMRQLEVTFLAHPGGMDVVLEADKPGGLFAAGHEVVNRHSVGHDADGRDWAVLVDGWLRQLAAGRGHGGGLSTPYGHGDPSGGHDAHAGQYGHGDRRGHGDHSVAGGRSGAGTAVAAGTAGVAVGVAAGLVAAEVVDEVGDFLEEDEEGRDGGGGDP
ncbi:sporulation protein [Streptomyces uncialis]|uniref:sporulation protein n=1 Tax=Streptomyces uncialis TaxID=1048205 RepID=UPI00380D1B95